MCRFFVPYIKLFKFFFLIFVMLDSKEQKLDATSETK